MGWGSAHLRELVVATYCLGLDPKETLNRLKGNMKEKLKISKGKDGDLGFNVAFAATEESDSKSKTKTKDKDK